MKYLSLCSGVGMFGLGIIDIFPDAECVGYSEIDKHAIGVYENNFPDYDNLGDITKIKKVPKFDLVVAGFPCLDLTISKTDRKGLKGKDSKLFYDVLRIIKKRKCKFLIENVASMSRDNKNKISELLGVEPMRICSDLVSAQSRERLYWFNWNAKFPKDKKIYFEDIAENGVDDKYYINFKTKKLLKMSTFFGDADRIIRKSKSKVPVIIGWSKSTRYPKGKPSYVEMRKRFNGKANTLTTGVGCGSFSSKNFVIDKKGIRILTPLECERLHTVPDFFTKYNIDGDVLSDNQRYKIIGNGVTKLIVTHLMRALKKQGFN